MLEYLGPRVPEVPLEPLEAQELRDQLVRMAEPDRREILVFLVRRELEESMVSRENLVTQDLRADLDKTAYEEQVGWMGQLVSLDHPGLLVQPDIED